MHKPQKLQPVNSDRRAGRSRELWARRQGGDFLTRSSLCLSLFDLSGLGVMSVLSKPHSNLKLAERTLFRGSHNQGASEQDTKLDKTFPVGGKDRSPRAFLASEEGGSRAEDEH